MTNPYSRAIINFGRWKSQQIDRLAGKPMGYWLLADDESIEGWSNKNAGKVWRKLISASRPSVRWSCSDAEVCPCCIGRGVLHNSCADCPYGEAHGRCTLVGGNTWAIITSSLDGLIVDAIGIDTIKAYLTSANSRLQRKLSKGKSP
jgi:hypothetical protein